MKSRLVHLFEPISYIGTVAGTVVASEKSGGVELRRNHDGPTEKRRGNNHERATKCLFFRR